MRKSKPMALLIAATALLAAIPFYGATAFAEAEARESHVAANEPVQEAANSNDTTFADVSIDSAKVVPETEDGPTSASASEGYRHSVTTEGERFNLTVSWNDPIAGQPLILHCVGSNGNGDYKFYLRSPKYTDPALGWDYVQDPTQSKYTSAAPSHDFEFTPMASGTYEFRVDCMNATAFENTPLFDTISATVTITIDDPAYPSVGTRVSSAVAQSRHETDGSEYQMALWLHNWLLEQLEYDNSFLYSSAEAALCRGTATCQGYTLTYQHLLNAAGIENKVIRDENDRHTWNAVKIDGNWCQIDCTWDDSTTSIPSEDIDMRHFYFGLTDELMNVAHPHFSEVYGAADYATPSKSLANGYYVRTGEVKAWADAYTARIQEHLNNKETSFSINVDNAHWPASQKGIYNGYVAYELNQRSWIEHGLSVTATFAYQDDAFVCTATYQKPEEPEKPTEPEKPAEPEPKPKIPNLKVQAHIANEGWRQPVALGKTAAGAKAGHGLEAVRLILPASTKGNVKVRTHVANVGWQDWVATNASAFAGTVGKSCSIEALQIKLEGAVAQDFDIWYRVKSKSFGWSGWAKNGTSAGSEGYGNAVEALEVRLVHKGDKAPGATANAFRAPLLTYSAHVQNKGWMASVYENTVAGTTGKGLRLEALRFSLKPAAGSGDIQVRTHVQNIGWQGWTSGTAGTTGKSLAVEAMQIRLTGDAAKKYDVWYRVHSADFGWLGWAKNGASAGSVGYAKAVQAFEIRLLPKGSKAPGSTANSFKAPTVQYAAHSKNIGWQSGKTSAQQPSIMLGTTGRSLPLQAFHLSVPGLGASGSITYSAHVQNVGWQKSVADGATAGTTGRNLSIEAVKIAFTGDLAKKYDVWYRAHVSNIGWLGWTKNGAAAGSEGISGSVEAVDLKILPKGSKAPGSTTQAFISAPTLTYSSHALGGAWQNAVNHGQTSGSTGTGAAIDLIKLTCQSPNKSCGVSYRVYSSGLGWQRNATDGVQAGAAGKQIEAIQISLTGSEAKYFDIWYRVYVDKVGWLGWAKNGASAGTSSCSLGAHAIQVTITAKGSSAPGSTANSYCAGTKSLPYAGYQTPGSYYKVSNHSVSIKNMGQNQFGYRTESRIPYNATRNDCVNVMIARAMDYLGTPYKWDYSCAPGVGVDCSGLVMQSLYACGMDLSPMNPWDHYHTPGHDQYANLMRDSGRFMHVSFAQRKPGDLLFWQGHVAIYLGGDRMIEAYSPKVGVRVTNVRTAGLTTVARPLP